MWMLLARLFRMYYVIYECPTCHNVWYRTEKCWFWTLNYWRFVPRAQFCHPCNKGGGWMKIQIGTYGPQPRLQHIPGYYHWKDFQDWCRRITRYEKTHI